MTPHGPITSVFAAIQLANPLHSCQWFFREHARSCTSDIASALVTVLSVASSTLHYLNDNGSYHMLQSKFLLPVSQHTVYSDLTTHNLSATKRDLT